MLSLLDIEDSWRSVLEEEFKQPYMQKLFSFLEREKELNHAVFPPTPLIFNAFKKTPFSKTKVVIVGQDPYHGRGQAHGLSFSVPKGVKPPPSLVNIFKEIEEDLAIEKPSHGCLIEWAEQGVLLLNSVLTVREKEPLSHQKKGWEIFTDAVLKALFQRKEPLVFVLWGRSALEKCEQILSNNSPHKILKAPHPSPFSAHRGFLGCKHFSQINQFLKEIKVDEINWSLS